MRRISLCLLMLSAMAGFSSASTFTASSGGNGQTGGPVDASASFTIGSGVVDITLTNLLTAETSIGQSISDISFNVSGASGKPAAFTGGGANAIDIEPSGVTSTSPASPASAGFGWAISTLGENIQVEGAGGIHSGQPVDLIVGAGPYGPGGNGNGGFAPHNPSLKGFATFDLSVPGVTSSSTISDVKFSFGTGPDLTLIGTPSTPSPVPEPTSILLLGTVVAISAKLLSRRLSA